MKSSRFLVTLVPTAVLGLAGIALLGASTGGAQARGSANVAASPPGQAVFAVRCDFSHRAPDDPIVAPGQPGASHSHDFFGNFSTTAHSTDESLRRTGTTCSRRPDRAAYWAPSLSVDGQLVDPSHALIYYRAAGKDAAAIVAPPAGLRVIAGDARATGPQDRRVVSWGCAQRGGVRRRLEPPMCPPGVQLALRIRFPDCWNGRDLDSPDHKGHMAYARAGACPDSHPVAVPMLTVNVRYLTAGGPGVTLASANSPYTGHADFWNAWDQAELERLVRACVNARASLGDPVCRAKAPRLRARVRHRRVRAGRRTRVRVTVLARRDGAYVPAVGAVVRLAGRSAVADAGGRARMTVRLPRAGRRTATVRYAGRSSARVTLRVLPRRR